MNAAVDLIILVILMLLSAFFSSAETALTTVSRIRMAALADEGNKRAAVVLSVIDNRAKMLSAILIGNNIVNISMTAFTTIAAVRLFGDIYVGLVTAVLTVLVILFGEIAPKNLAAAEAEALSLRSAGPIRFIMTVMTPVIFIVEKLSRGFLRLFKVDPDARPQMTEHELRAVVSASEEDGVIEDDEREMINNVVDLSDTAAKEIMIPRADMVTIPDTFTWDEIVESFREHRYTRLPVYQERQENIIGILNIKDLLMVDKEHFRIEDVMREPCFIYEMKNISDLLDEMRLGRESIVIVLDEYGSLSGMITMEDVLEEIVGDIYDEYAGRDVEEITEIVPGKEYSCLGSVDIDTLNKTVGLNLVSEDYDSIGGYIIGMAGDRLPKTGKVLTLEDGTRLIVEAVRKNRILRVHIYLPAESHEADSAEED